MWYKEKQKVS